MKWLLSRIGVVRLTITSSSPRIRTRDASTGGASWQRPLFLLASVALTTLLLTLSWNATDTAQGQSNDATLTISGDASYNYAENGTFAIATFTTNAASGTTVDWSVAGADASSVSISSGGALSFRSPPNFESPGDANGDNTYSLTVKAAAGEESATLPVAVSVTNVNEAPYFIWKYSITEHVTPEGYGALRLALGGNYGAEDPEGTLVAFTLTGADADKFRKGFSWVERKTSHFHMYLNSSSNLDYENPEDANQDGVYEVTINASDGTLTTPLHVTLTVLDVNEIHTLTGPSGLTFPTGGTGTVATYTVIDPDGATIPLTLGGTDAASFEISDGALSFKSAPDHQIKSSYSLTVTASDDTNTVSRDVTVLVVDSQQTMTMSGTGAYTISENTRTVWLGAHTATHSGGGPITWSVEGADASSFSISADGGLSLNSFPNFEVKNSYSAKVKANAGTDSVTMNVSVAVTDGDDYPAIVGPSVVSFPSGGTGVVGTFSATDEDAGESATLYWYPKYTDDTDNPSFNFDTDTGELTFKSPPDYRTKSSYTAVITADQRTQANGYREAVHHVTVRILPEELTVSGSSAATIEENATDLSLVTYTTSYPSNETIVWSLEGTDAGAFTIGANGELSFSAAPDFESPADADSNNVYSVTVKATARGASAILRVSVTVTDVDEGPALAPSRAPGRVTGLGADASHSRVTLSWSAPDEGAAVTSYRILRRNLDSEDALKVLVNDSGRNVTSHVDRSVEPNARYSYRVQALSGQVAGPVSAFINVTTSPTPPPGRVLGLGVSATPGDLVVSAKWNAVPGSETLKVPGANAYKVQWRRFAENSYLAANKAYTAAASAEIAVAGVGKWVVRVQGCNQHGCGLAAIQAVEVIAGAKPGRATGLHAAATTSGGVSLSWETPSDGGAVTGYRILRRAAASEQNLRVLVQNTGNAGTSWTDDSVSSGTKYVYRAVALNEFGQGEMSLPAIVTTPK